MDYQKFRSDYESSGLSQTEYGKRIGKSSSMVSYYLRKARTAVKLGSSFSKIEVVASSDKVIRIKTTTGVDIEIPL